MCSDRVPGGSAGIVEGLLEEGKFVAAKMKMIFGQTMMWGDIYCVYLAASETSHLATRPTLFFVYGCL